MFTQCHKCETVFRLSADALRAAGGQVRCGRCGEVFNALARLAEDAGGFTRGESSLDLENRANEILQSAEPVPPAQTSAAAVGSAHGVGTGEAVGDALGDASGETPADEELTSEASLEFTLPPGELDRIFIETTPSVLQVLAVEAQRSQRTFDPANPFPLAAHAPLQDGAPPAPPAGLDDPAAPHDPTAPRDPTAPHDPAAPHDATAPRDPAAPHDPTGPRDPAAPRDAAFAHSRPAGSVGFTVPDDVRREMLSSYAHAELPPINAPRRRVPYAVWVGAAVVLAALLAMQFVTNGDWPLHLPLFGAGAQTAPQLSAYQLRQWGVNGDPGAKGTLRVSATVVNAAARPQPYPLLRVTLANRFGARIAQRDFEPREYLDKSAAATLAPGAQAQATLEIMDPGKDAEGFEIDVCLREFDKKVHCAADAGRSGAAQPAK